jgi:pimeloyl-ACP methyl ester carboxylesterase
LDHARAPHRLAAVPPILFLPGAAGSAEFWRPVADRLAGLGPAHRLGYPGFGGLPPDPAIRSLDDLFRWVVARLPEGASHVVAQSMGGVLAARLAIELPERVDRLVLCATSGGVDVARLGGAEWRHEYRRSLPDVPGWFVDDRTDLTARLPSIRARTLLLWSDADPVSPLAVAHHLAGLIPGASIETVAGGTHAFARELPDRVAAIVRAHLA